MFDDRMNLIIGFNSRKLKSCELSRCQLTFNMNCTRFIDKRNTQMSQSSEDSEDSDDVVQVSKGRKTSCLYLCNH